MHTDQKDGRKILVCTVGRTVLHYDAGCIDDLHPVPSSLCELEHNARNNRMRAKFTAKPA
jgi:hypothetical protein